MTLRVKVIPRSPKTEFAGEMADGTVKVRVAAPPEKGKANKAIAQLLAKWLGLKKSQVELIVGDTSSEKRLLVHNIEKEALAARIEAALAAGR